MNRLLSRTAKSFSLFFIRQKQISLFSVNSRCQIRSSLLRYISSTERNIFSLIKAFESSPRTLNLAYHDGVTANLHYIWLRDNCQCHECVDFDSKQKQVDTANISEKIRPKSYHVTDEGGLQIVWPEGSEEEHISTYDPVWLYKYTLGYHAPLNACVQDIMPPIRTWNRKKLENSNLTVSYSELMSSNNNGVDKVLDNLYTYGITYVKDAPCHENEVLRIMGRFTFVTNTKWGSSYHVVTHPVQSDSKHLAFSGNYLELHTDMNYLKKSPGIQALHCLEYSDRSTNCDQSPGKSIFVDGFEVANWMKDNYPNEFSILTSVPVKFKILSHDLEYISYQYILKSDSLWGVSEVHYNNRTLAPFEGPKDQVVNFYRSYKMFGKKLRDDTLQYSVLLKPGDVAIYNNLRVLHGRLSFDPSVTASHLVGCYGDLDEMIARYRYSMRKRYLT